MKEKKICRLIFIVVYNVIIFILIPWLFLILGDDVLYETMDFLGAFIFIYEIVGTILGLLGLYIYKKYRGVSVHYLLLQSICILIGVVRLTYFASMSTPPELGEIISLLLIALFPVLPIEIVVAIYSYIKEHYEFSIKKIK